MVSKCEVEGEAATKGSAKKVKKREPLKATL
jgi:hypothetical protein